MKVLQSGRLGNFLFQWAFANYLAKENHSKAEIIFDRFHSDVYQFHDLEKSFNSNAILLKRREIYGFGFKTIDYLSAHFPQKTASLRRILKIYTEGTDSELVDSRIYRGFFQNSEFALSLKTSEMNRLQQRIDSANIAFSTRNQQLQFNDTYQIIHLRLGDYKNSQFGVLKLEHMLKLTQPDLPILICTDGSKEEVVSRIGMNPYLVLTPSECDAWETLSLMARAKRVISSNSTLSWWGAFLAYKNGSEVFLPNKWKKVGDHSSKMLFEGVRTYDSSFE